MKKLTRQEYDDLYIAYTEALEAVGDLGGKHALRLRRDGAAKDGIQHALLARS